MKNFKKYFEILMATSLFTGIAESELESMLSCLEAQTADVKKDEILLLAGKQPEHIGIVLAGQLHIVKEDYDGNRTIVAVITTGEIFAEALCCAGVKESPVTVLADCDSTVMMLRFNRILHTCPRSCGFHARLIENMLGVIARKNLLLQSRLDIIAIRSVREKVLRYLNSFTHKPGQYISIPFNREELANYLCVERSALSHELSRMKKDGLIDYHKNQFCILYQDN